MMRSRGRRQTSWAAEHLESRLVLSTVTVMPAQVSLASVNHGQGAATVAVLGDSNLNVSTIDVGSLTLTATSAGGGSPQTLQLRGTPRVEDISGGGSADLIMHFARSGLKGLDGQVTIDVQGTTTVGGVTSAVTDFGSGTLTIFAPGGQHPHGPGAGHHNAKGSGMLPIRGQGHGSTQVPVQGQGHGSTQLPIQGQGNGAGQLPVQGQVTGSGQVSTSGPHHPQGPAN